MLVPLDKKTGSLLDYTYTDEGEETENVTWCENFEFAATLKYTSYSRGRSAAHLLWQDESGRGFNMFLSEFNSLMKRQKDIVDGCVTGRWTFVKRGKNYSIRLVG
jgi:hypothetical protein